jgi:hypothetical protein
VYEIEATEGRKADEQGSSGGNSDESYNDEARSVSRWLVSDPQGEPWAKQRDNCGGPNGEGDPESGRSGDSSETERKDHRSQECPPTPRCSRENQPHQTGESDNDDACQHHDRCCLVEWLRIKRKRACADDGSSERQNPDRERACDHNACSDWRLLLGSGIDAAGDAVQSDECPVAVNARFER